MFEFIEIFLVAHSFGILVTGILIFLIGYILPVGRYEIIFQFVGVLLLVCGVYLQGKESEKIGWEKKMAEAESKISQLETKSKEVNEVIITKYVPKIQYVEKVRTQVVKEYVPVESDAKCEVNNGFVRLHDSVVNQKIIEPDVTDTETSSVKLSEIGLVVKENYSIYYSTAEKLNALQEWVKTQEKLWNEGKKK